MPSKVFVWNGLIWHSVRYGNYNPAPSGWPFDSLNPARRLANESIYDGIPATVPIVNATDYTSSTDIYTIMQAVENDSSLSSGVYIQLEGKVYTINDFKSYGTNTWYAFANSNRRAMGLLGVEPPVGADPITKIRISPTAINNSSGARTYCLNDTDFSGPVPITVFHMSNQSSNVPMFFAGIDFQGTLQTPYGVYASAIQSGKFKVNQAVASPLAWNGITNWRGIDGARMQFCKLTGFAFALNSSPPFECGAINSNYEYMKYRRIDIDGRIAAEIDPNRPFASGGFMPNKGQNLYFEDSRVHHTRRSGFATNTSTNDQAERYNWRRIKVDNIAEQLGLDGWAGDSGLFNAANTEEVVGQVVFDDMDLSTSASRFHINLAEPYASSGSGSPLVLPSGRPIVIVKNGFRTLDTIYGGCLRINVSKTPNSTGVSPAWQKLTNLGIDGSGLFDIKNAAGVKMIGVKANAWDSSMTPDRYYVVNY